MSTDGGKALTPEGLARLREMFGPNQPLPQRYGYLNLGRTAKPLRRATPDVGRNDPCPCGSGKKFKKCCLARLTEDMGRRDAESAEQKDKRSSKHEDGDEEKSD